MKQLIFLLLAFSSSISWGQSYDRIRRDNQRIEPFVRYFNFYDGVQMIELDYLSAHNAMINRLEQEHPRALSWSMVMGPAPENVYIFRNRAGIRVKQFGKTQKNVKLLSVKKSEKVAIPHRHFTSFIGATYGLSGIRTRVYPYYLIGSEKDPHNKFGLIDSLGNIVLKQQYDQIISNYDGSIFLTQKDSLHEIRNRDLELEFASSELKFSLSKNQRAVRFTQDDSGLYGLKDAKGKTLIPCKYKIIWSFNEFGLAQVRNARNEEGFVDSTGKEVIEVKYQNFGRFTEGLIAARFNNKQGFLNSKGETVIPFIYDHAFWFAEGLSRVSKKIDGVYHFGYIDKAGNEVIPLKYANANDFKDGIAEVRIDFENECYVARAAILSLDEKPERRGVWIKIDREGKQVK